MPNLYCNNLVRIGNTADGGKWVCRPWLTRRNCIVYSFGVGNDISFEQEMIKLNPRCNIFSYDPNETYKSLFADNDERYFILLSLFFLFAVANQFQYWGH